MHSSADIDTNNEKKKRKIVLFYNANKVGVDCFDQMNLLYTKISATQRLPLAVWGNNLDIVAINSWIHFKKVRKESVTSREFILMLIEILINKQSKVSNTKTNLKTIHQVVRKQRKCHRKCCENKTVPYCISCQKPTCGKCFHDNFKLIYVKCRACTKIIS